MLTQEEKLSILNKFPNIKLSYEKYIHKKVYDFDIIIGIPKGVKCFVWFTMFKNNMVCISLELDDDKNKKKIKNIRLLNLCFSSTLCYGSIFYGTLFYHMNNNFFSIENIYYNKGKNITNFNFYEKINILAGILKNNIKQISYNNNFVIFGLPLISTNREDFNKKLQTISYKLSSVKYIKDNYELIINFDKFNLKPMINTPKQESLFICKPDIQNDIYHLYTLNNKYVGLAAIPDYKTSIMMNKILRIIKENDDLDALEESDDEEEFENSNIDKFVHINKTCKVICSFNNKLKKWTPIKLG